MPQDESKIFVGTSGYSYQDWKGPFYPPKIRDRDMLAFYARRFRAVEVNFTYYRMPAARTTAAMRRKAPGILFTFKLPGKITHEGELTAASAADFRRGVEPIASAGVLGCLLAQFPWRFKYSPAASDFVKRLAEHFGDMHLVGEFRHASWAADDVYDKLGELGVGFCNVDEPSLPGLMPATDVVTSSVGYFRFHGRNAKKWWRHDRAAERYDYLYAAEELTPWLPRVKGVAAKAEKTFVFMNNHPLGQAVTNAEMMRDMLGEGFAGDAAALF